MDHAATVCAPAKVVTLELGAKIWRVKTNATGVVNAP
jgi:hypothetical protein